MNNSDEFHDGKVLNLTFPKYPIIPTSEIVFDDSELDECEIEIPINFDVSSIRIYDEDDNVVAEYKRPNWFKRRWLATKRKRKQFKLWRFKMGKLKYDPEIRMEFRRLRRLCCTQQRDIVRLHNKTHMMK